MTYESLLKEKKELEMVLFKVMAFLDTLDEYPELEEERWGLKLDIQEVLQMKND